LASEPKDKRDGVTVEDLGAGAVQHGRFLREFIRKPASTGAVAPSSPELARSMVDEADLAGARVVVEYGPGTGPITRELLRRLPAEAKLIAIERNIEFVALLQGQHPELDIAHDSVENLHDILNSRGETAADRVVSALPGVCFEPELQREIITSTRDALSENGLFVTFAYVQGLALPRAWRFRQMLRDLFSDVRQSDVIWANVPPAFIYTCRK
jgi:phosphatidylethanolamine/phosphatidyl-N-methylethanolamine N-methyltransferase